MSSSLLARNERHRLIRTALRIRVVVYAAVGVPILMSAELSLLGDVLALLALGAAAVAPIVIHRVTSYSGIGIAATIDVLLSFAVWVAVPVAAPLTLVVTVWAVATMVVLAPQAISQRFALFVVGLELAKLLEIVLTTDTLERSTQSLVWTVIGRTAVISAVYFVTRALDQYFSRLYVASESASARYRRLMDAAPTALVVVDDGRITYANTGAIALLAAETGTLDDVAFDDLVESDYRDRCHAEFKRVIHGLETANIDGVEMRTLGGVEHFVDITANPVDIGHGLSIQVALHDVSAQKQAETELAETKLNYRSFFERIPVALYRTRPNGDIIQANRGLVELLGARSEAELVGLSATDFYADPSDRDHLTSMLADQRVIVGYESRMRRLDGAIIWVRDTARLIDTDIGPVYEGAMVDVTGRRNIEDELWSRAMQQEAAASIGQLALEADDINGVMRTVAETVARVLRTDGAAILQRSEQGNFVIVGQSSGLDLEAADLADLADRAHMTAAPVVLRSGEEMKGTAPALVDLDVASAVAVMIPGTQIEFGTLSALSYRDRAFTSDDLNFLHSVANVLAAAVDRAAANERLEELLRSKDSFVASVSHELRTPLTVVTGMAHELQERWRGLSDEEMDEFTQLLVEQSMDMADLIEDLLVAARSNIGNVAVRNEPVDLEEQVRNVLVGFANTGDKTITSSLEPGFADADPIRVRQIIRNLITNALRYGGPNIEVVMSSTAGARVVEVVDDGAGIPVADRERIFVAYERAHHTEGQPGSVGLGLTVSRTLAELMGGSLTYRFDGKSHFMLELSRDLEEEANQASKQPADTPAASGLPVVGLSRRGVDVGMVD
ncbi:MAG: PAS domain-containing sensor histidine kinase [Acidimicrobiia bacterium]|nr:PAS domain-containing sensor histidine kinase [Acidimicrobiia bacterium]